MIKDLFRRIEQKWGKGFIKVLLTLNEIEMLSSTVKKFKEQRVRLRYNMTRMDGKSTIQNVWFKRRKFLPCLEL